MKFLQSLTLEELEELFIEMNEKKFRAEQVFSALHAGKTMDEISTLSKQLRETLEQQFSSKPIRIEKVLTGKKAKKFLFQLHDGQLIEGVLMNHSYGNTLCLSTQVGCRMGCAFCASGLVGLIRNLECGEIVGQVTAVNRLLCEEKTYKDNRAITNLVLMGMGEPLDNFDHVIKFLKIINHEKGLNISLRNISLSTCGIVPKINELSEMNLPITLTISLHAPNEEMRKKLMPVANAYSLKDLIAASKNYYKKTGRRVIFEYALIGGVNDSAASANELSALIRGFPAHVNLIPLNSVPEKKLKAATRNSIRLFEETLKKNNTSVTIRQSLGEDIEGACGQLRAKFVGCSATTGGDSKHT